MRSNWEIHGRVPCRAWQAAGIGMGEGRERHCWAGCKGTAQAAQEQPCSLHRNSPAPSALLLTSPAPGRPFTPLPVWVCRRNTPQTSPEPSSAGAAQRWLHLLQPLPSTGHHITLGEGKKIHLLDTCVLQAVPFGQTHQHFNAPPNLSCVAGFGRLFLSLN